MPKREIALIGILITLSSCAINVHGSDFDFDEGGSGETLEEVVEPTVTRVYDASDIDWNEQSVEDPSTAEVESFMASTGMNATDAETVLRLMNQFTGSTDLVGFEYFGVAEGYEPGTLGVVRKADP